MVTLKDYVSRMKDNQKDIYYITGMSVFQAWQNLKGDNCFLHNLSVGWEETDEVALTSGGKKHFAQHQELTKWRKWADCR